MVDFKSSGFDKRTGGKSGKFEFDCDGCILFTPRIQSAFFILFLAAELSLILQRLIYYTDHSDSVTETLLSIVILETPGENSV